MSMNDDVSILLLNFKNACENSSSKMSLKLILSFKPLPAINCRSFMNYESQQTDFTENLSSMLNQLRSLLILQFDNSKLRFVHGRTPKLNRGFFLQRDPSSVAEAFEPPTLSAGGGLLFSRLSYRTYDASALLPYTPSSIRLPARSGFLSAGARGSPLARAGLVTSSLT